LGDLSEAKNGAETWEHNVCIRESESVGKYQRKVYTLK
jgi:hypothetical protein